MKALKGFYRLQEDDVPFSQRFANKKSETPQKKKPARPGSPPRKRKSTGAREQTAKRRRSEGLKESDDKKIQWKTLRHNGLLFPPEYQPHGVKMLYDGVPVDLTPEQEEVCSQKFKIAGHKAALASGL